MNILVLSDLHIDACDNFGTFQWDELDLIGRIEYIRDIHEIDQVILNGDIFELIKYNMSEIREANPVLFEYFRENEFIFIKGNHDILSPIGFDYHDITNSTGQKIHIEHGHNADIINGTKLGRSVGRFALLLLRKVSHFRTVRDIYFRIIALEEHIHKIPKRFNTIKYLAYALRLLKDYDVVILGHTHKLESHHTYYLNSKKRYLNSGSCSLGRFQGIVMDTETLKYEFIRENRESLTGSFIVNYAI